MALKDILNDYEMIRRRQQDALREREREAYSREPALRELAKKRSDAARAMGRIMQSGNSPETLRNVMHECDVQEAELLKKLGLPEDHLKLHYDCDVCKDTGYIGNGMRTPCQCLKQKRMTEGAALGNLKERFENFDEKIFRDPNQLARTLKAKAKLEEYAQSFPDTAQPNIFLSGAPGLGKTFLLNAVAHRVAERGFSVKVVSAYNLIRDIVNGFSENDDRLGTYFTPDLVVLDDLGTEPMMKNVTVETINALLNERIVRGCHTLTATNLTLEQLRDRYGERVFSRLIDTRNCMAIRLEGQNLRITGEKA